MWCTGVCSRGWIRELNPTAPAGTRGFGPKFRNNVQVQWFGVYGQQTDYSDVVMHIMVRCLLTENCWNRFKASFQTFIFSWTAGGNMSQSWKAHLDHSAGATDWHNSPLWICNFMGEIHFQATVCNQSIPAQNNCPKPQSCHNKWPIYGFMQQHISHRGFAEVLEELRWEAECRFRVMSEHKEIFFTEKPLVYSLSLQLSHNPVLLIILLWKVKFSKLNSEQVLATSNVWFLTLIFPLSKY